MMNKDGLHTKNKVAKQPSPAKNVSSKNLVSPVLKQVGKLAAGVATIAGGSATGNPRNKHALQPGHSLMDWIRLGSSGQDLTGVGSRAGEMTVTVNQLAQHNKADDAWISIRGRVYNVTRYLAFHPGGPDELIQGIGKDSTDLFNQVHSWVNYESILQKCYIGRLVAGDPNIDTAELFFGNSLKLSSESCFNNTLPKTIPPKLLPNNKVTPLDDTKLANTVICDTKPKEIILPRFDWIQKTDYITIIFYTKLFSNPQVEIKKPNVDNVLSINLEYDNQIFTNDIQFNKAIEWPCQVKISYETGKIEIQFRKVVGGIWENYGTLKQSNEEALANSAEFKYKYTVINKMEVNYNTSLLELQRCDESRIVVPIGRHVQLFNNVQGQEVSRSYTPVPNSLFAKFKSQTYVTDNICLLVKSYSQGCVSKYICGKSKGDTVEVSKSLGSFSLDILNSRETFLLIAGGTGITPLLSLLLFLLERRIRKCQSVTLLFFNRIEKDVLIRNHLDTLQSEDNRFKVKFILTQAGSSWKGLKGQISKSLLIDTIEEHLQNSIYKQSDLFSFICGPTLFTNLANSLLMDVGFKKEQIHLFVG